MAAYIHSQSQGAGPQVSLLHGWGMNASVFGPLADAMGSSYRVNRIDLPGYGRSDPVSDDFATQVERLADAVPPGTLLGWSMGGLYALSMALCYPERYPRLLLVAATPCFVEREDWPCAMRADYFHQFADALVADWSATIHRFIGLQMHGAEHARETMRQISVLVEQGGAPQASTLQFGLDLLLQTDLRPTLANLRVPALVVLGQRDRLVPASLAQYLSRLNPAIEVNCQARSAHAPFLSQQHRFIELFHEFVESTPVG